MKIRIHEIQSPPLITYIWNIFVSQKSQIWKLYEPLKMDLYLQNLRHLSKNHKIINDDIDDDGDD